MEPAQTEMQWPTENSSAPQASRFVAWVATAGAIVFGVLLTGMVYTGDGLNNSRLVFVIVLTFVHLISQAVISALSWKLGSRLGKLFVASLVALGCVWFIFSFNLRELYLLIVSAIVSISAVTIDSRESQTKTDG